jgi:hypothetical protein
MRRQGTQNALYTALLALALAAAILPSTLQAQDGPSGPVGVFAGVHLMLAFPQGDFKSKVSDIGFGGNFELGYAPPEMPIAAGLQLGYVVYGSKTYTTQFSEFVPVSVDVDVTNSIGLLHLFVRMMPPKGDVRPYVEGLLGGSLFTTSSTVKNRNTSEEIAGDNKNSDVAFSYGGSAGLLIRVWSDKTNENQPVDIYLDARVRYFYGGNAEYYTNAAVSQQSDGRVIFDKKNLTSSKTDFVTGQLGVTFKF